jgi:hypothetical protein
MKLIVVGADVGELSEVNLLLFERFAAEAGKLHVVEFPVELDVFAGGDLFGGSAHYRRGEEVDCWDMLDEEDRNVVVKMTDFRLHPS